MTQEPLNFSVILSGSFWAKRPQFSIWLDDHVIIQREIPDEQPHTFEFSSNLNQGTHNISIRLENKTNADTLVENNEIVKDMLLNINDIIIDDISLGQLLWDGEYILDQPQLYQNKLITRLDHCVNLGWNGTYKLEFSVPFYVWLLEKL